MYRIIVLDKVRRKVRTPVTRVLREGEVLFGGRGEGAGEGGGQS